MRVKTVPRHLPRKFAASVKGALEDCEMTCDSRCSPVHVKNIDCNGVGGIFEQLDQGQISKQDRRTSVIAAEAALDLSTKWKDCDEPSNSDAGSNSGDKFKDTYLYQLMTDPQFLRQASRDSRVQQQQHQQQEDGGSSCPYCKRQFVDEAELKVHLSVSADEATNQLSCCACGKSFAQKRYLRYHQRSHSERSKYSCDICTRKYSRLDNLTRHNIFHTNPDKFPCNSCERTFARKDLLNKHLKCHENKYKYHCDICQKYFKGPVSLDNHTKLFHAPLQNGPTTTQQQHSFQLSNTSSFLTPRTS